MIRQAAILPRHRVGTFEHNLSLSQPIYSTEAKPRCELRRGADRNLTPRFGWGWWYSRSRQECDADLLCFAVAPTVQFIQRGSRRLKLESVSMAEEVHCAPRESCCCLSIDVGLRIWCGCGGCGGGGRMLLRLMMCSSAAAAVFHYRSHSTFPKSPKVAR